MLIESIITYQLMQEEEHIKKEERRKQEETEQKREQHCKQCKCMFLGFLSVGIAAFSNNTMDPRNLLTTLQTAKDSSDDSLNSRDSDSNKKTKST